MPLKHQFPAAALLLLAFVPGVCPAQATSPAAQTGKSTSPGATSHSGSPASSASSGLPASGPSTGPDCAIAPCDDTPQHIAAVNPPPPAPAPWSLPERLKWMAEMLLMVIAAAFAWMTFSALHKIERQTRYSEETAQAAVEAARAALLFAESQARAERPWILVSPSPMPGSGDSFSIMATNRGRNPARIVTLAECIAIAKDETELPADPLFKTEPRAPLAPILLLPGESANIKSFSREEVKSVCESPEEVRRIEEWEEKIYLYGNVVYTDLAGSGKTAYETGWCCWYIHGRQKSGMIMAGPPEYNRHT